MDSDAVALNLTQGNRIGIYKNYKDLGIIKSTWS